jgi:allophanate hydrolase
VSTAPEYRLFALDTTPPKPGLVRVASGGSAIEAEVWELPVSEFGDFVARIPPPLAIGKVHLADDSWISGFLCEETATVGAKDITATGGWRPHLASHPT